jgi:hypothetical protein
MCQLHMLLTGIVLAYWLEHSMFNVDMHDGHVRADELRSVLACL